MNESSLPVLPLNYVEPHWYAVHTRSRHEKRVADQLLRKNIDFFLPLYESERRWSDRKMRIELPLFPGYIFVQIPLKDRLQVLELVGVAKLVSVRGEPVPLDDKEIGILRQGLTAKLKAEPHPYLKVGQKVRVKHGPLSGLEGILIKKKDNLRLIISVDLIMRSVSVEIAAIDVHPL